MLSSYLIYIALLVLLLVAANKYKSWLEKKSVSGLLISLIILFSASIIIGGRYDVGTDWSNYKFMYEALLGSFEISEINIGLSSDIEPFYLLYSGLISLTNVSFQIFSTITYFLLFILLFTSFRLCPKNITWGVFFYMTSSFLVSLNILRQYMSLILLLYFIPILIEDKKVKYYLGVFSSIMFHYSNLLAITLPIFKLKYFRFLENKMIASLIIVSSFLAKNLISNIAGWIIPLMGNDKYLNSLDNLSANHDADATGLGALYLVLFALVIIYYSDKISERFQFLYKAYIIGSVVRIGFTTSIYMGRIAMCLTISQILFLPFVFSYLFRKGNMAEKILGITIILVTLLRFYLAISNPGANYIPYEFKF